MNFSYRSYFELIKDIRSNIKKIPPEVDIIVGIPRSGLLVANIISQYLSIPFVDIERFFERKVISTGRRINFSPEGEFYRRIKNVLIVDDSINSGKQFHQIKERLKIIGNEFNFIFLAVYATQESKEMVDICFDIVSTPRIFEWNLLNSWILNHSCVDMDGVICHDPSKIQNDDGPEYLNFIRNAPILFKTDSIIQKIVTSRLEKYREETQKWLFENKIKYNELIMLDLNTKEERQRLKIHAKFKAEVYKNSNCILFIESTLWQAIEIKKITGLPVFCTENMELLHSKKADESCQILSKKNNSTLERAKSLLRRIVI